MTNGKLKIDYRIASSPANAGKDGPVLGNGHPRDLSLIVHAGKLHEEEKTQKTWKLLVEKEYQLSQPIPKNKRQEMLTNCGPMWLFLKSTEIK